VGVSEKTEIRNRPSCLGRLHESHSPESVPLSLSRPLLLLNEIFVSYTKTNWKNEAQLDAGR
jgi:hypothetical protein